MVMLLLVELTSSTQTVQCLGVPLRCSNDDQIHRMSHSTCVQVLTTSEMSALN